MNAVTVAWIIAACVWAFAFGCSEYRVKKAKEEAASNWRVAQYNADEVERTHERRCENHRRMNRLARKSKQRGKTIETLERRIGILNAQILVTDGVNARLAPQVDALKTEKGKLAIENGRLKQRIEELEQQIEGLKRHDNCPFRRTAKNRISYCTKEDK
jgi:chromosome segregation ATPase